MMKADFKSLRGGFKFNTNHYPIQDFYLVKVAKRPDGKFETEIVKKVFANYGDAFAKDCPMKWASGAVRRAACPPIGTAQDASALVAAALRGGWTADIDNRSMSSTLVLVQILNGLQLGVLLFLIAAGLTLVFGVMDFINLAHGVQYMLGAYLAVAFYGAHRQLSAALVLALLAALAFGLLLEFLVFRHLYDRDHLDQVIATFGIILFSIRACACSGAPRRCRCRCRTALTGTVVLMPGSSIRCGARHHRHRPRASRSCFISW